MQDGYDFDYAFIDEAELYLSDSEMKRDLIDKLALYELSHASVEPVHSLADAMQQLLGIAAESMKEAIDLICQYADSDESEALKEPTFPKVLNCSMPKSEHLPHRNRIPWNTSGFH